MRDLDAENQRLALARGVSPGLSRSSKKSVVANAEEPDSQNPDNPAVNIRRINQAVLYEMSIVTRAAYLESSIENRMSELGQRQSAEATNMAITLNDISEDELYDCLKLDLAIRLKNGRAAAPSASGPLANW